MNRFIAAAALGCLTLVLAGCASLSALPSVASKDNSPRTVGMLIAKDFGPAIEELANACEADFLSENVRTIIADYGPTIRQAVGFYAATARPCLVSDGMLGTDPEAGGTCVRGSLSQAAVALPAVLKSAGQSIGGEDGRDLYLAGLVASTFIGDGQGGTLTGFKPTADVPLTAYDAAWLPVQANADRLTACAAKE